MNPALYAVRLGIRRGLTQFRHIMTTGEGLFSTILWNGIPVIILFFNRDSTIEGSALPWATVVLPGFLGLMVAASAMGPAYYLAAEREDGTLLRAKAVPHGMVGYVAGMLVQSCLETMVGVALLLATGFILFPGFGPNGVVGAVILVVILVLGLLATLPLGLIVGSIVRSARTIGFLSVVMLGAVTLISGIVIPLQSMWGWLQVVGQLLPVYWLGLGMRFAFLPESAVAWEIGGSWRLPEMFAVLTAWAVVGLLVAPVVLRRMARRESGSAVASRREAALQRL